MPYDHTHWRLIIDTYTCPTCGAEPGHHCRTGRDRITYEPHADRGRQGMRCPRCRALMPADAEPGDVCPRCAQVRALEVERATYHQRHS